MTLKIHNSLTGRKEVFTPLEEGRIRMYVCGITVYDYLHLGHVRMLMVFDVVTRYLRQSGYDLTYVRNITDVDDKIIKRAGELGESIAQLTEKFIRAMHEDCEALGIEQPDHEPKATETMDAIITMIEALISNDHAYLADNGDVYYDVSSFPDYGQLSGKNPAELRAGARVEINEAKRDPLDFTLWKASKAGEPAWESPWGPGRPGWHIECSAMSTSLLGDHFDIHAGGMDLKFPHHENEIAQSCGATGKPFVNVWMHNGFVRVDEEKMSKSLGNFFTVREVLQHYQPEVIRYFMLASHYRSPLNYAQDNLDQARSALDRLYLSVRDLAPSQPADLDTWRKCFNEAMDDDFNTPQALAVLQNLARVTNAEENPARRNSLGCTLRELGGILGLLQADPENYLKRETLGKGMDALGDEAINALVAKRNQARADKNWQESDRIRDELASRGIVLEDDPKGTTWRRE